jgi:uncharacterized protein DUF5329
MFLRARKSAGLASGARIAILAAVVAHGASAGATPLSESEKIDALIHAVEARADLQFIRMNTPHSAAEAATMLRIKLSIAGSRVTTADDFIDKIGTHGVAGDPYFVRYPDGSQVSSAVFLRQELRRIERARGTG